MSTPHPRQPDRQSAPGFRLDLLGRLAAIGTIRHRVVLVIIATAVLAAAAGGVFAAALLRDPVQWLAGALATGSAGWLMALAMSCGIAIWLWTRLAGRLLEQAGQADAMLKARRSGGREALGGNRSRLSAADLPTALVDNLTGLGNHRAFHEALDAELLSATATAPLALVLIDLDDFTAINEHGGHVGGDEVLAELARMMRRVVRRTDIPFRIGGDEFALLMPATYADDAALVVRRLLAGCVEPRPGTAAPAGYSFSAGISDAPVRATDHHDLIGQAEQALFDAKRAGRTSVRTFEPGQQRELDSRALQRAGQSVIELVRASSLTPVYQPIVEIAGGRVVGFEGLVRPLPGSGFDDPGTLFTVAEATGRMAELDRLCLQTLLEGATAMAPDQTLSLNLSPHTLEAPEFSVPSLVRTLADAGFEPGRVVLELTERQTITDVEALRRHLTACQAAGFRVAVDDVGAGNAGLRLLSQLHFDIVKIDLTLVHAGARREASLEVLRSLAELASRWGAKAVAEGVETASQLRMIRDLGLAEAQGYLLGRPSPRADLRHVPLEPLLEEPTLRARLGFTSLPVTPLG